MTKDETLKLALEALELHGKQYPHMVKGYCLDAITAIKKALAEPEQAPMIWIKPKELLVMKGNAYAGAKNWRVNLGLEPEEDDVPLYTEPQQRTWVDLTDKEIEIIYERCSVWDKFKYERMLEAKLKEKNT